MLAARSCDAGIELKAGALTWHAKCAPSSPGGEVEKFRRFTILH
jgi:hypothetical protein